MAAESEAESEFDVDVGGGRRHTVSMAFVFGAVALISIYAMAGIQRRWESAFWGCESIVFGFEERAVGTWKSTNAWGRVHIRFVRVKTGIGIGFMLMYLYDMKYRLMKLMSSTSACA